MSLEVRTASDTPSLLSRARGVLFDFDGPICRLWSKEFSRSVAEALWKRVCKEGPTDLLMREGPLSDDPHAVLRAVHGSRDHQDLLGILEAQVAEKELVAARREAQPTRDAAKLIRRMAGRGLRLAVVTNNSAGAASYYLESQGLAGCFRAVHGRTRDLDRMKPNPYMLLSALNSLGLRPDQVVMIGDSPADVIAAREAEVPFIGYGRNERKESDLRRAGAERVLDSYALLLDEE
ncbi:MAG: HAD family hydrolase [Streptomyces sp.]|nr:HAD family hydrolase [Streptomyces sp.]